jgi:predicted amidophosphoribosyltransferase
MRTETFSPRVRVRLPPRSQAALCSSCRAPQERFVGPSPFCAECLERTKAHDASDPYDELGEGD